MKGSRIHGIVRELKNENIDIVNYTNNTSLFIQRSLTPAKVTSISLDDKNLRAFSLMEKSGFVRDTDLENEIRINEPDFVNMVAYKLEK